MPLALQPHDIALRIGLTFLAGLLIGLNRGEHGRPAGLRTTLLVSLAACLAMLQVNALLNTGGKPPSSFITLDLMRLPLGILSGMGFIGGGAILRRDSLVLGVTTAATLWFVTVVGLCFGGGQITLGLLGLALGLFVLWVLQWVEQRTKQERHATLQLLTDASGPGEDQIRSLLAAENIRVGSVGISYMQPENRREFTYELWWRIRRSEHPHPGIVEKLAAKPGVVKLDWKP
ncbi:MAG TPA: MgtC/SapB family protein [Bryobacteraceae bacterium]|jgi:putative Mg2+ transporter-C (MgtC) family protein